ncbi:hypothetical protein AMTR_s00014p00175600 [Amborella trichopoda]|uniref:Uncharacterized protein n=1 Tax=Amborella trichopoda TaxID=13333 RepID=W1PGK7_AMBTC|nr:hypothetical protein AMTR_s00014p00175600 [Amborella trichopoda]
MNKASIDDVEIYDAEYNDEVTDIHETGENGGVVDDEDTEIHEASENSGDMQIEEDEEDVVIHEAAGMLRISRFQTIMRVR